MDILVNKLRKSFTGNTLDDSITITSDVYTSSAVEMLTFSCYAIQCVWDAVNTAPVVLYVEASNDNETFTVVDSVSLPVASSAANRMLNVEKAGYAFVRIRVDASSGEVVNFRSIICAKVI